MKIIIEPIKKIFIKPNESKNVETWKIILLWFMRVFVFVVSVITIISGDWEIGFMTLVAALVIAAPAVFTKDRIKDFPIEIELMLFFIVFIQYYLGEILDLYYTTPYFDKFAHFTMVLLIAAISYTVIFTMNRTGRLLASKRTLFLLTILIAMGIGGIWEIIEYGLEFLRINYFPDWVVYQGSLVEDAYHDTMNDLLADFIGSILGAIFTIKFVVNDLGDIRTRELMHKIKSEIIEPHPEE